MARRSRPTWSRTATAGLVLPILLGAVSATALDLSVTGNWSTSVSNNDLVAGAGSDLLAVKESVAGQATLDITATGGAGDAWRLDVQRSDSIWHAALGLEARRTSNGTGSGSISGGASYVSIGAGAASFFSGDGDREGVTVQLRLTGLSIAVAPASYSTTVLYTLVDL